MGAWLPYMQHNGKAQCKCVNNKKVPYLPLDYPAHPPGTPFQCPQFNLVFEVLRTVDVDFSDHTSLWLLLVFSICPAEM